MSLNTWPIVRSYLGEIDLGLRLHRSSGTLDRGISTLSDDTRQTVDNVIDGVLGLGELVQQGEAIAQGRKVRIERCQISDLFERLDVFLRERLLEQTLDRLSLSAQQFAERLHKRHWHEALRLLGLVEHRDKERQSPARHAHVVVAGRLRQHARDGHLQSRYVLLVALVQLVELP